jgi:hypothetical protein
MCIKYMEMYLPAENKILMHINDYINKVPKKKIF